MQSHVPFVQSLKEYENKDSLGKGVVAVLL